MHMHSNGEHGVPYWPKLQDNLCGDKHPAPIEHVKYYGTNVFVRSTISDTYL